MVLAVAWAVYLIPKALKHHDEVARTRSIDRFSTAMRVLARREPVNRRDTRLVVTPARPQSRMLLPTTQTAAAVAADDNPSHLTKWASWRQGLGVNILNPKIGAFYVALLPQFIPTDVSPVLMGALLAVVHSIEGILWFTLIIAGAHAMRAWLRRSRVQRGLNGITGATLIGFGVALALPGR